MHGLHGGGIYIDGITHRAMGQGVACGLVIHDRSLDAVMKMYVDGSMREVDCMACLATSGSKK